VSYALLIANSGNFPLACVAIIGLFILLIFASVKKNKNAADHYAFICLSGFLLLLLFSLTYSVLVRPVLIDRYLFPAIGLVYIFFAIEAGAIESRTVQLFIALCLLTLSVVSFSTTVVKEKQEGTDFNKFETFIKTNVAPNDVFVYSDWQLCDIPGIIAYLRSCENHIHCLPEGKQSVIGNNTEFRNRLFNQSISDCGDNLKDFEEKKQNIWLIELADKEFPFSDTKIAENSSQVFEWNRYHIKIKQLKNISHE
jgi:hypothetical protein